MWSFQKFQNSRTQNRKKTQENENLLYYKQKTLHIHQLIFKLNWIESFPDKSFKIIFFDVHSEKKSESEILKLKFNLNAIGWWLVVELFEIPFDILNLACVCACAMAQSVWSFVICVLSSNNHPVLFLSLSLSPCSISLCRSLSFRSISWY